eukprot:633679-Hanusia_phi.AAC.1
MARATTEAPWASQGVRPSAGEGGNGPCQTRRTAKRARSGIPGCCRAGAAHTKHHHNLKRRQERTSTLLDSQLATRLAIAFAADTFPSSLPLVMSCARTSITPVLPINLSSSLVVLLVSETTSCAASALSTPSCDLSFGICSKTAGRISEDMEADLPSPSSASSSSSSGCHISALLGFFGLNRYFKIDTLRVRMPGAEAGPYMSDRSV